MSINHHFRLEPFVAGILFGFVFVAGKYLANVIPPGTMSFLRYTFAIIIFAPVLIIFRESLRTLSKKQWFVISLAALFGIVGYHVLFYWALHFTSPTNVALIHASNPVITLILGRYIVQEKITKKIIVSFIVAVIGIMIVVGKGNPAYFLNQGLNTGELLMLVATIIWALYTILLKRIGPTNISPFTLTGTVAVIGWVMLIPVAVYEVDFSFFRDIAVKTWVALAYMGVGSSGLGYFLYTRSVRAVGPALTSLTVFATVPIVVSVVSLLWLGIPITIVQVLGFAFILAGLFGVLKKDSVAKTLNTV